MIIHASGRSALILAAGLFVCFAEPSRATAASADDKAATSKSERATSGKSAKQGARHWKRYGHRRSTRVASKSSVTSKVPDTDVADAAGPVSPAIPAALANTNTEITSADAAADSATAMSARANSMLLAAAGKSAEARLAADASPAADTPMVAADQRNDVDRTLQQAPSTETVAVASARAAIAAPALADSNDGDQTSLIGKIFIGFGALLTMASAARMFLA